MTKTFNEIVAAIDVGSNFLRMLIVQINKDSSVVELEDIMQPTKLGRDTFASGGIKAESIHETCKTLKGFSSLMKDYGVNRYRAVATSGIREAYNVEYVLDQIYVRTGLRIKLISNSEERFLIYKTLRKNLPDIDRLRKQGILIINIRMGGMEATVYSEGNLHSTEYIQAGSLRLRQTLEELECFTIDFPGLMEEYLDGKIYFMQPYLPGLKLQNIVGLGEEAKTITRLCSDMGISREDHYVSKQVLAKLYKKIRLMTAIQIENEFQLHHNEAEILLPTVMIFNRFLDMTIAEGFYALEASLRHGIIEDFIDEAFDTDRKNVFLQDMIHSVWCLGERYNIEKEHAAFVRDICLSIYDQTRASHKLGKKDRLLLEIAAILHDIGHYVDPAHHYIHSYSIIRASDIMGLSGRDHEIIANVARYHGEDIPHPEDDGLRDMKRNDRVRVAKMAAIIKLAEALDTSHRQKIKKIHISVKRRKMDFAIESPHETLLEEWSFMRRVDLFEEVSGYKPVIIRKD